MEINCTFATSVATPEHIETAEQLGYTRAYVYDSPGIYADAWMTLALAAARTARIRLGVAVVTPHVRHVLANAAATAHLAALAPDRVDLAVGAGFTSSALLGRKPSRWADVERYVVALRALLAGQEVEWDGAQIGLLHGPASGVTVPVEVPIWVAAHGPKGFAVASRVADGVITNPVHGGNPVPVAGACSLTFYGTVLDEGETLSDARVVAAAGPGAALALHLGPYGPVAGTAEQLGHGEAVAALDERRRHLELHRGHLIEPNATDRRFLSPEVIKRGTLTGSPAEVADYLRALDAAGAASMLYQPAGPDIPRELETFMAAAQLALATPSDWTEAPVGAGTTSSKGTA